jgi:hypothetical protein
MLLLPLFASSEGGDEPEVGGEGGVAVICVMLVTSMIVGSTESGFLPARFFAFA